jgi:hypothetical protein
MFLTSLKASAASISSSLSDFSMSSSLGPSGTGTVAYLASSSFGG